jgi:hypothetical protein
MTLVEGTRAITGGVDTHLDVQPVRIGGRLSVHGRAMKVIDRLPAVHNPSRAGRRHYPYENGLNPGLLTRMLSPWRFGSVRRESHRWPRVVMRGQS